jgi:hypothetical protein
MKHEYNQVHSFTTYLQQIKAKPRKYNFENRQKLSYVIYSNIKFINKSVIS